MKEKTNDAVYVIEGGGLFKIGTSSGVARRLKNLQITCPVPLTLVKAWARKNGLKLERELHERLAGCRRHGEWFELPEDVFKKLCADLDELEKTWLESREARKTASKPKPVSESKPEIKPIPNRISEINRKVVTEARLLDLIFPDLPQNKRPTRRTLLSWRKAGILPCLKMPGAKGKGRVLYDLAACCKSLNSRIIGRPRKSP